MYYPSNVVIALDLAKNSEELYGPIHRMDFLKESHIHFVHCVLEPYYSGDGIPISQFPRLETKSIIEAGVISKMERMSKEILPHDFHGKTSFTCLFSDSPKKELLNYIKDKEIDLTVISTPEDRNFFHSSFASYIGLQGVSDVFVLRAIPNKVHRFKGRLKVIYGTKMKSNNNDYVSLKKFDFLNEARIKMLYISQRGDYRFLKNTNISSLPTSEEQVVIEEAFLSKMNSLKDKILPDGFIGTYDASCLFSDNVKNEFLKCADEESADIVVLVPDKKKIFGGFINFQVMNARSNILILRGH